MAVRPGTPGFRIQRRRFSNMGDKYYGDVRLGDHFVYSGNKDAMWHKLGDTIAWAIENGVEPYNHLFRHPLLSITADKDIRWQIEENDRVTVIILSLWVEKILSRS